jgi:hypothetical protein
MKLKLFLIPLIIVLPVLLSAHDWHDDSILDNVDIDIEDNDIIITENDGRSDEYVKITEDHGLIINGKYIRTNWRQKRLLEKYYDTVFEVRYLGKKMGIEGAKMGVAGAQVAILALSKVVKLFFVDGYDGEDFEEEIDEEVEEHLEESGEYLEELGDDLKDEIEDLEELHEKLIDEIPAIERLDWF